MRDIEIPEGSICLKPLSELAEQPFETWLLGIYELFWITSSHRDFKNWSEVWNLERAKTNQKEFFEAMRDYHEVSVETPWEDVVCPHAPSWRAEAENIEKGILRMLVRLKHGEEVTTTFNSVVSDPFARQLFIKGNPGRWQFYGFLFARWLGNPPEFVALLRASTPSGQPGERPTQVDAKELNREIQDFLNSLQRKDAEILSYFISKPSEPKSLQDVYRQFWPDGKSRNAFHKSRARLKERNLGEEVIVYLADSKSYQLNSDFVKNYKITQKPS